MRNGSSQIFKHFSEQSGACFFRKNRIKSISIAFSDQNDALTENNNMVELFKFSKLGDRIQREKVHEKKHL